MPKDKIGILYAEDAELVNYALFNMFSKEWKQQNHELCLKGMNIMDLANTHQLIVLSNLESLNAELIKAKQSQEYRLRRLREIAIENLHSLAKSRHSEHFLFESPNKFKQDEVSSEIDFNQTLKDVLSVPPPRKRKNNPLHTIK